MKTINIKNEILNIKVTAKSEYQRHIQHLKKVTSNHGFYRRKQIINLTTSLNKLLTHLQLRINLWDQNTALTLEHENLLSGQSLLVKK